MQFFMKREEEVIDCWYDSGSAFLLSGIIPLKMKLNLRKLSCWFYLWSTWSNPRLVLFASCNFYFLFDERPYKNVLTLGLVLDENNQKMNKSKRNYVDPNIILENEGADALRWYLLSANAPWNSTRFLSRL